MMFLTVTGVIALGLLLLFLMHKMAVAYILCSIKVELSYMKRDIHDLEKREIQRMWDRTDLKNELFKKILELEEKIKKGRNGK